MLVLIKQKIPVEHSRAMRFILEFDTLAVMDDPRIRQVVDAYLQGECDGVTAANKLGWEFSTWQTYIAEVINLALYLAQTRHPDTIIKKIHFPHKDETL